MTSRADWQKCVNQSCGLESIGNLNASVEAFDNIRSPIDQFYGRCTRMSRVAIPDFFLSYPDAGGLLVVGVVSAVEGYFRELISRLLLICPVSREKASDRVIKISSVLWFDKKYVLNGVLEHISLADSESIKKALKEFLAYELKKDSPLLSALSEFEKVCEIRHSIVHSSSIVAAKNAIKLNIEACESILEFKCNYALFQQCFAVCNMLIATCNSELFFEYVSRWALKWPQRLALSLDEMDDHFRSVWSVFYSEVDFTREMIDSPTEMERCKELVREHFDK